MADILIKGMEMPTTCCHCPLMGYDPYIEWNDGGRETQGAYICVMTHELIDNTKREEHCPLVHAPPHGRLISAKRIEFELCESTMPKKYREFCRRVIRSENLVPTVIPADKEET